MHQQWGTFLVSSHPLLDRFTCLSERLVINQTARTSVLAQLLCDTLCHEIEDSCPNIICFLRPAGILAFYTRLTCQMKLFGFYSVMHAGRTLTAHPFALFASMHPESQTHEDGFIALNVGIGLR